MRSIDSHEHAMPRTFTLSQVAESLNMSRRSIENFVADGSLPCVRFGRSVRIRVEDLQAFVETRTRGRDVTGTRSQ
jgi:excisionase family DNA binding protein